LSEERPFLDGQTHGTVNSYDENGALTKQKRYSHGRELPE
jgi:antitoxin component YwqK of YwqJK toxin-antitoxin module